MSREMKKSGVAWFKSIPSRWSLDRLKSATRITLGKMLSPDKSERNTIDLPYVRAANLSDNSTVADQDLKRMWFSPHEAKALALRNGDVLVTEGGTIGLPLIVDRIKGNEIVCFQNSINRLRSAENPRFLFYWMKFLFDSGHHENNINTVSIAHLTKEKLGEVPIFLPPRDEQRRIAAWLDVQTGRIDKRLELLGKKRELLQELRQGLIDEAMLSGFAGSELVQTGQAALPSMPIHWSLSKFKRMVFFREGPGIMAADFTETGVALLRIGNIKPGLILMAGCNYLSPEKVERQWRQFKLRLGDIVISASASTGIVSEVGIDAVGAIPYTGLITLRPKSGISKEYLKFFVISSPFLSQIEEYLKGSTIHHFGPTHLRQMLISVPPVIEQNNVVRVLEKRVPRIDTQITLIDQLEQLIKQQRKAIIHDAVTGKIDLSTYVPPQPNEALAV